MRLLRRLRDLKRDHGGSVRIFSAHDPSEYEQLAARPVFDEEARPAESGPKPQAPLPF